MIGLTTKQTTSTKGLSSQNYIDTVDYSKGNPATLIGAGLLKDYTLGKTKPNLNQDSLGQGYGTPGIDISNQFNSSTGFDNKDMPAKGKISAKDSHISDLGQKNSFNEKSGELGKFQAGKLHPTTLQEGQRFHAGGKADIATKVDMLQQFNYDLQGLSKKGSGMDPAAKIDRLTQFNIDFNKRTGVYSPEPAKPVTPLATTWDHCPLQNYTPGLNNFHTCTNGKRLTDIDTELAIRRRDISIGGINSSLGFIRRNYSTDQMRTPINCLMHQKAHLECEQRTDSIRLNCTRSNCNCKPGYCVCCLPKTSAMTCSASCQKSTPKPMAFGSAHCSGVSHATTRCSNPKHFHNQKNCSVALPVYHLCNRYHHHHHRPVTSAVDYSRMPKRTRNQCSFSHHNSYHKTSNYMCGL